MSKRDRDPLNRPLRLNPNASPPATFELVPKAPVGTPADGIAVERGEPAWVGWVVQRDAHDGYRRVRVRLPQSVVDAYATEEPSGPDLRGNLAVQIQVDMMRDAFLEEVVRASRGEP